MAMTVGELAAWAQRGPVLTGSCAVAPNCGSDVVLMWTCASFQRCGRLHSKTVVEKDGLEIALDLG